MVTDDELAAAMVTYPNHSTEQLAKLLSEPVRNIEYRISRPGFAYKVAVLRNSGFADAAEIGSKGITECLNVLSDEMKSTENYSGERINAAKGYADIAIKCHQIAKQDIELLRLRAFIEENERRRSGVAYELPDAESESTGRPVDRPSVPVVASEGGVRVSVVNVENIAADANVGDFSDGNASANDEIPLTIAPDVQDRIMGIVSKFVK